jgi:hypothetical protein
MAVFYNSCNYPVRVTARHYSNTTEAIETAGLNKSLDIGEKTVIFDMWGFSGDIGKLEFPFPYQLKVIANNKSIDVDFESFLKLLKRIKHDQYGNFRKWSIKDPVLCP